MQVPHIFVFVPCAAMSIIISNTLAEKRYKLHISAWFLQGVVIFQVGNRIIQKRLHVRIEHVQPSRCREEFLERRKSNDIKKAEAKARGETIDLKRQPAGPRSGFVLDSSTLETVTPIPYDVVNDLKGGY